MTQEAGKRNQEEKWNKIYSTKEWEKLKWELGQIFSQWISVSENGAIEGNPAIHRIAQYAFEYAQAREQPWVRVDSGQLPEVGDWIIMHHDYGDRKDLSMDRYNKNLARFLKDNQVTHWMKITPPAPSKF